MRHLVTVLFSLATLLQWSCEGADGQQGAEGERGADGSFCSITDSGNGTITLSCEDGVEYIIRVAGSGDAPDAPDAPAVLYGSYAISNSLDVSLLQAFTEVTGDLIVQAPGLVSLNLPALETLGGRFIITDNPSLASFSLPALTFVGQDLRLQNNRALASFYLPMLTRVGLGGLLINRNHALTSFDLSALSEAPGLSILDNAVLPHCLAEALVAQVQAANGIDGAVGLSDNLNGCVCDDVDGTPEATCP